MDSGKVSLQISRIEGTQQTAVNDVLAVEEPLEISMVYGPAADRKTRKVSITMRTPGHDRELAAGFLFTEGIISSSADIRDIRHTQTLPGMSSNYVEVVLQEHVAFDTEKLNRNFYTTSSCGVCGKSSLDAVKTTIPPGTNLPGLPPLQASVIVSLPEVMRAAQDNFESTGGLHASGLFDYTGKLLALREDVGRHNALDKLVGWGLMNEQLPFHHHVLMLSGRASFELLQKSAMAGIRTICAVGAPSSLAVDCAREFNICLIGFLRGNRFNVYHQGDVDIAGIQNVQG